jgi:peroxiredoxin
MVAISPQLQHYSEELVKERRLPFEVLGDKGNAVADKFGLAFALPDPMRWVYEEKFNIDVPTFNGDDSWILPMPARYVVDGNGIIRYADVNLDHTSRPDIEPTLEVLRGLRV